MKFLLVISLNNQIQITRDLNELFQLQAGLVRSNDLHLTKITSVLLLEIFLSDPFYITRLVHSHPRRPGDS